MRIEKDIDVSSIFSLNALIGLPTVFIFFSFLSLGLVGLIGFKDVFALIIEQIEVR